jgi:type II secretory pathway component PulC
MKSLRLAASAVFVLYGATVAIAADTPAPAPALALAQDSSEVARLNPLAAQRLELLSATVDHPLFSPGRRPPPEPVAQVSEPIAAPPAPPPNLVLSGIVLDGQKARAVVRLGADRRIMSAQIGDNIEGWTVSQIDGRTLIMSLDGRLATFTLFNRQVDQGNSGLGSASPVSDGSTNQQQPLQLQQQDASPAGQSTGNQRRRRKMGE